MNLQENVNAHPQSPTIPRLSHRASRLVTLDEMEAIPAPEGTETWRPVQHRQVVEAIHSATIAKGLSIASEEYSVTHDDKRLFGILKLRENRAGSEWSRCIGIRTGNDKIVALGIAIGVSVFVCDNGCFTGERIYKRRHTAAFDLESVMNSAFDGIDTRFDSFETRLNSLKGEPVSRDEAAGIVVSVAEQGGIRAIDILPVLNEFEKPRHEEFAEPTRWSLLNAFTEISKLYHPRRYHTFQRVLAATFNLDNQ